MYYFVFKCFHIDLEFLYVFFIISIFFIIENVFHLKELMILNTLYYNNN